MPATAQIAAYGFSFIATAEGHAVYRAGDRIADIQETARGVEVTVWANGFFQIDLPNTAEEMEEVVREAWHQERGWA